MSQENREVIRHIFIHIIYWMGVVTCIACVSSLFMTSEWIAEIKTGAANELRGNDSNAGSFLRYVYQIIVDVTVWLKELPLWKKIAGIIIGGIIWIVGTVHDVD